MLVREEYNLPLTKESYLHLREKIEIDPAEPRYLKVVWGKGYRLETDRKG